MDTVKGTNVPKPTIENPGNYWVLCGLTMRALTEVKVSFWGFVDELNESFPEDSLIVIEQYVKVLGRNKPIIMK